MAWTTNALIGFGFSFACLVAATACDDGGSGDTTSTATTSPTTTTSTTGGGGTPTNPIPFSMGWAAFDQNTFGIQGAFYTFGDSTDGGGSTIAPESFADAGTEVCAQGSAGQVMDGADGEPAYSTYWGAAIGFNLSQEDGGEAMAYDAMSHSVTGFQFVVGGANPLPTDGGKLRFNIDIGDGHNYCKEVTAAGLNTFKLSELHQDCWLNDATLPTPNPTSLLALHWQYVTNEDAAYAFDLCITAVGVTTD